MNSHAPHRANLFMQRALQLAELGRGYVSPNPLVGCVIEVDGKIIGEGWHRKYGEAHAEVNAINSVHQKALLARSHVYVTLEPCSHFGKTPPCADLLIAHQVQKVFVCTPDPNPLVAGKGIKKLKDAGIEVEVGVMEEQGRELNKRFFTFIEKQRPYIILKWAQTSDGFVARENYDSKWISGELSRQVVHRWRAEESAILVGGRTALHDNPALTVRMWSGTDPVRIVIDKRNDLPGHLQLFDGHVKTIMYTETIGDHKNTAVERVVLSSDLFLPEMLADLHKRGIQSIIVEGGADTLTRFIKQDLWDEARVFTAATEFGKGISAPRLNGKLVRQDHLGNDTLKIYYRQ